MMLSELSTEPTTERDLDFEKRRFEKLQGLREWRFYDQRRVYARDDLHTRVLNGITDGIPSSCKTRRWRGGEAGERERRERRRWKSVEESGEGRERRTIAASFELDAYSDDDHRGAVRVISRASSYHL